MDAKSLVLTETFVAVQGEGIWTGTASFFLRTAGCPVKCPSCFHSHTKVHMADFTLKSIKDVEVGDRVMSYDTTSHRFVPKSVVGKMARPVDEVYMLVTANNPDRRTYLTGNHPLYVRDKGWVPAEDLQVGDHILHLSISEIRKMSNPMKNPATAKKVGDTMRSIGHNPWVAMSDEQRALVRESARSRMLDSNPMKNPETAIKGFLNRKDRGRKSCVERYIERIAGDLGLVFVGDGSLVINHKVPDFVIQGTKKLVEVWAEDQTEFFGRDEVWVEDRRKHFESEGYEVLFLPVLLRNEIGDDSFYRKKISEFARNGCEVVEIKRITQEDTKIWARLAGKKSNNLTVFNLEVEDTHTYIANSMVAKNCDTIYSWAKERPQGLASGVYVQVPAIDIVIRIIESGLNYVVVTGGEPAEQADAIKGVITHESMSDRFFTIETSGNVVFDPTPYTLLSLSPKLKGMMGRKLDEGRYDHLGQMITAMVKSQKLVQIKYVIAGAEDYEEAKALTARVVPAAVRSEVNVIFQPNNMPYRDALRRGDALEKYAENLRTLSEMFVVDVGRGGIWRRFKHARLMCQQHFLSHGNEPGT